MADRTATQGYGGFWIRFLAYLVDSVIFFTVLLFVAAAGAFLGEPGVMLIVGFGLLGPVLYWGLMQSSARQATFGKALLGLKVTDGTGNRISLARSLGREVAKYISAIPLMIGFLLAAFTKRKQALHDLFASTTVVREGPGHLVVGLVVGIFGWLAPAALMMFLGVGLIAGMMGGMAGAMMTPEVTMQAPKPAPKPPAPLPARVAKPQPPAAVPVAAPPTPAPAPQPAPAAVAAAPAPRASAPAAPPAVQIPVKAPPRRVAAAPPAAAETPMPQEKPAPAAQQEKPRTVAEPRKPRPAKPAAAAAPAPQAPVPTLKYNDLMTAVLYRDPATVSELLAFGKWPDKVDSRGMTPLMVAAMLGDAASAEALLKAGADANRPGPRGDTAVSIAREQRNAAMLDLLQRYGAR